LKILLTPKTKRDCSKSGCTKTLEKVIDAENKKWLLQKVGAQKVGALEP
jgi:hypothetical protein